MLQQPPDQATGSCYARCQRAIRLYVNTTCLLSIASEAEEF
jgi:hypothetical protein